jgi:DNA-binding beta-propeller fold protein YncE
MTRYASSAGAFVLICALLHATVDDNETFAGPPLFVTNNLTDGQAGGRLLEYDGSTGQLVGLVDNVSAPRGIVVGPNGNLFVASATGDRVLEYAFDNGLQPTTFVAENEGGLQSPHGLTFGPDGNLYVTSFRQELTVYRFDGETGDFVDIFASYPLEHGWGRDLVFGPGGDLYVSTLFLGVFRFDGNSGEPLGSFVSGEAIGPLGGITFGPDGELYAAASELDAVLRFNGETGEFIDTFVAAGAGGLDEPHGIGFGPDGNLYVASSFGNAILRYDGQSGAFVDTFAVDSIDVPQFFVFVPEPSCLVLFLVGACISARLAIGVRT